MGRKSSSSSFDSNLIREMRRLRGLNFNFSEIAEKLNRNGFKNSKGKPLVASTIVYLFKKTKSISLAEIEDSTQTPKQSLIDVVLRGPLQPDVKIGLIEKIQKGEITDLNYKKSIVIDGGGRTFEKGNLANPASKVAVTIGGEKLKERCRLIVHFYDEIKAIAELQGV